MIRRTWERLSKPLDPAVVIAHVSIGLLAWTFVATRSLGTLERLQTRAAEGIERVDTATRELHESNLAVRDAVRRMDATSAVLQRVAIGVGLLALAVTVVAVLTGR